MYVITVYDIGEKRVSKVHKIMNKYLHWIQNSVFEGDITKASLESLKEELRKKIKREEDSILFFVFSNKKQMKKEILGIEKAGIDNII